MFCIWVIYGFLTLAWYKQTGGTKSYAIGNAVIITILLGIGLADILFPPKSTADAHNYQYISNSGWDGSVSQVQDYLKGSLRDPDSYESIEWGKVTPNGNGGYSVTHKFRAKNGLGGYDVEEHTYTLDSQGNVILDVSN